jgi:hypothetical protein
MAVTQAKAVETRVKIWKVTRRLLVILLITLTLGWGLHRSNQAVGHNDKPVGFIYGVWHGALMPCALPLLLCGGDVVIYAPKNTGHSYKLGYTLGVNGCGLIFFSLFFWRVKRWRNRMLANRPGEN